MQSLAIQQQRLKLQYVSLNQEQVWSGNETISGLRDRLQALLPAGLFDPQDLEHQVLFRLTTFDPQKITESVMREIIDEQKLIIEARLKTLPFDLEYLLRGLKNKYHDLNCAHRLVMEKNESGLVAHDRYGSLVVEYRPVTNPNIVSLFTNELHYIHQEKTRGETFGFFFHGEEIPWAVETTEPSVLARDYKRSALLAHGVDPNKGIELTRFYTLPGAPKNAISLMDRLIADYYRPKGIEALYTTAMPMYAKTRGSTIAGGIDQVLLVKPILHRFVPVVIGGRRCYRLVTRQYLEEHPQEGVLYPNQNFPIGVAIEFWKRINPPSLPPLDLLQGTGKAIYISQRSMNIEKEIKLPISDVPAMLAALRDTGQPGETSYIRDSIFGTKSHQRRIRMRLVDNFFGQRIVVEYKYPIESKDGIKTEVEERLYEGTDLRAAVAAIQGQGDFQEQNSYEKIRTEFHLPAIQATVDIYPFGAWLELEGGPTEIWRMAEHLGYQKKDARTENADQLYLEWQRQHGLPEQWDVRFGLRGRK